MNASKLLVIAGWVITLGVTSFMLRDISPDLQQAPWAVKANAGLGVPGNVVLAIGILGLVSTLVYALPQTSTLGAILLTGFLGGAIVIHLRVTLPVEGSRNSFPGIDRRQRPWVTQRCSPHWPQVRFWHNDTPRCGHSVENWGL